MPAYSIAEYLDVANGGAKDASGAVIELCKAGLRSAPPPLHMHMHMHMRSTPPAVESNAPLGATCCSQMNE